MKKIGIKNIKVSSLLMLDITSKFTSSWICYVNFGKFFAKDVFMLHACVNKGQPLYKGYIGFLMIVSSYSANTPSSGHTLDICVNVGAHEYAKV